MGIANKRLTNKKRFRYHVRMDRFFCHIIGSLVILSCMVVSVHASTFKCAKEIKAFDTETPSKEMAPIPKDISLDINDQADPSGMYYVTYIKNGEVIESLCHAEDVGKMDLTKGKGAPVKLDPSLEGLETFVCKRPIDAFDVSNPTKRIGVWDIHTELRLNRAATKNGMIPVAFQYPDGKVIRAQCWEEDLSKKDFFECAHEIKAYDPSNSSAELGVWLVNTKLILMATPDSKEMVLVKYRNPETGEIAQALSRALDLGKSAQVTSTGGTGSLKSYDDIKQFTGVTGFKTRPEKLKSYMSVDSALTMAFENPKAATPHELLFDQEHLTSIESKMGSPLSGLQKGQKGVLAYTGKLKDGTDGCVVFDSVVGRYHPMDYMVVLDHEGKVKSIEMLVYREQNYPVGDVIPKNSWSKQFVGKSENAPPKFKDNITNITKATMSCEAVTDGVNKILATIKVFSKELGMESSS